MDKSTPLAQRCQMCYHQGTMSAVALGPSGLPIQLTPVLPPTPPTSLLQPTLPQAPTAIPSIERQTQGNTTKNDLARRDNGNNSPPPSGGGGRVVDISA